MNAKNLILIVFLVIYFIFVIIYFSRYLKNKEAMAGIGEDKKKKSIYLFPWEKKIAENIDMPEGIKKLVFYFLRIASITLGAFLIYGFGAIAFTVFSCLIVILLFNNKTNQVIEDAGINYIEIVNHFLDSYVPSLSSGLSNDQAMLKYIASQNDEELTEWWAYREDKDYVPSAKWKRCIEVYEMMKFNEEKGISDSLYIIKEMQEDITKKQEYYNDYQSKMGEITPILISYYFFLPFIMFMSYKLSPLFWFSFLGMVVAIGVIVLFIISQFLIYKLKKSTINIVF